MQEMANVSQVAGRLPVAGLIATARPSENVAGIFDEVLNAMMAYESATESFPYGYNFNTEAF